MTNIDLDKAYVILWSARTRSFHFETYTEMVEKNVRAYNNQTGLDYICLGVFESVEIANEMANTLEDQRKTKT
jgi:hypothetical protein